MFLTTRALTLSGRRAVPHHLARTCRVSNTISSWWVRAWSAVLKTNEAMSVEEMVVAIEVCRFTVDDTYTGEWVLVGPLVGEVIH